MYIYIVLSLCFSHLSAITVISKPGEVYSYGTIIMYAAFFSPIGTVLGSMFYLPVLLQLEMVSIYKVRIS